MNIKQAKTEIATLEKQQATLAAEIEALRTEQQQMVADDVQTAVERQKHIAAELAGREAVVRNLARRLKDAQGQLAQLEKQERDKRIAAARDELEKTKQKLIDCLRDAFQVAEECEAQALGLQELAGTDSADPFGRKVKTSIAKPLVEIGKVQQTEERYRTVFRFL